MTILFKLPDDKGQIFDSTEHLPLVVYFYPKDNTPGCTLEALDFTVLKSQFQALGYTVVGISRDSIKSHEKFCEKHSLSITLLSDSDETVCRLFEVIKEKNMYGKKVMGIERSTFILDKNSEIIHQWRKVKTKGHAQVVLDFIANLAK